MKSRIQMAEARSGARIDLAALRIVSRCQPDCLQKPISFDIIEFFEFDLEDITGVSPDYNDLPYGIFGVTDSNEKIATISKALVEDPESKNFARSTIAHECGHAVLHVEEFRRKQALLKSFQQKGDVQLYRKQDVPTYRNPEWQAHRFAGALLMPSKTVQTAIKNGMNEMDMVEIYEVSLPFVKSRLKALNLTVNNAKRESARTLSLFKSGHNL